MAGARILMNVRPGRSDWVVELHVAGEVDVATAPALWSSLVELAAAGSRTVVVDLRCVRFIDCCVVGLLVDAAARLRASGGALVVRSPSPLVRKVLELVDAADALGVTDASAA